MHTLEVIDMAIPLIVICSEKSWRVVETWRIRVSTYYTRLSDVRSKRG